MNSDFYFATHDLIHLINNRFLIECKFAANDELAFLC